MIISEVVAVVKCRCIHPSHFTAITAFDFDHLLSRVSGRRFLQLVFGATDCTTRSLPASDPFLSSHCLPHAAIAQRYLTQGAWERCPSNLIQHGRAYSNAASSGPGTGNLACSPGLLL